MPSATAISRPSTSVSRTARYGSTSSRPFLVVVAAPGKAPRPQDLHAFVTNGRQGVNYARGTWHHPLIAFEAPGEFLVIDRGGPGENNDEVFFGEGEIVLEAPTV